MSIKATTKTFREWDPLLNRLKPAENTSELPTYEFAIKEIWNFNVIPSLLPPPYSSIMIQKSAPQLQGADNLSKPPSYEDTIANLGEIFKNQSENRPLSPPTYLEFIEKTVELNLLKLVDDES